MQAPRKLAALLLGALLAPACAGATDRYAEIARGLGKAAQRGGVSKLQILPFASGAGETTQEGRLVASRIMTALIEQGRVLVVEGDLPPGIPDPYNAAMGRRGRKVDIRPEAEAVVLGTHVNSGKKIHLQVQLLRLKDRVVLFSADKKVKNEWFEDATVAEAVAPPAAPAAPAAPEAVLAAAGPVFTPQMIGADHGVDEADLTRDAVDEEGPKDCAAAADEVDRLQSSIIDIKARYVALKLRASPSRAKAPPQTLIQNGLIRDQFNAALEQYLEGGSIPPLSRREIRTLLVVDGKSFEIHRRCLAAKS